MRRGIRDWLDLERIEELGKQGLPQPRSVPRVLRERDPEDALEDLVLGGNARSGSALLFGRKTYQMMEAFWPTPLAAQQMPVVAEGMNAAKKYVASRTIQPTWSNTHLLRGNLVEAVRALKESDGPGITLLGSGDVAAQLGEARLVDEYQFVLVPIALGAGRSVFTKRCGLRLVEQRTFRGGSVVVTYAVE